MINDQPSSSLSGRGWFSRIGVNAKPNSLEGLIPMRRVMQGLRVLHELEYQLNSKAARVPLRASTQNDRCYETFSRSFNFVAQQHKKTTRLVQLRRWGMGE